MTDEERRRILDELAQAEMSEGIYHCGKHLECSDDCCDSSHTVRQIKDRFDLFWVFVPKYDAWRLGRKLGTTNIVGLLDGGSWVIHIDFSDDWMAVGVEMPAHPGSVIVPKEQR